MTAKGKEALWAGGCDVREMVGGFRPVYEKLKKKPKEQFSHLTRRVR